MTEESAHPYTFDMTSRLAARSSLRAILLALTLIVSACAPGRMDEYPTLANQGVLPLSTTNAYVGSNLFLAREAERSPYLYNFLKGKGGPTAIEIVEPQFGPARVLMFYPRDRETYAADIVEKDFMRQWIIRGPYAIQRKDYRRLASLDAAMNGEPVFFIRGKLERFRFEPPPTSTQILEPIIPTPKPTPKPKAKPKAKKSASVITAKPTESPAIFRPLNTDQQAIQMSLGFAERAPSGDVVHTVQTQDETLKTIAQWYTGSAENAAELAKVNSLGPSDPLALGTRITVPLALVKNFKRMGSK